MGNDPDSTSEGSVAAVARVLSKFFAAVSFVDGSAPNYRALRGLFSDGARLIKNTGTTPEISTVDEFIAPREEQVHSGALTSFEEVELGHITEMFGNVGHRFSTYEKRGVLYGEAFEAIGVISTQFIRTPDGWRISAMAWDDERPGVPVPDRYR